jgi:surfactin synthase thioesterase subunit
MAAPTKRRCRWFLREPLPSVPARLFCLPYSGCGASMYRRWPVLHEGVNFCPIQLPGRENRMREASFDTYQKLADVLAEQLVPYLDKPYGLFGHCSSALAAYETAVRLVQRGYPAPANVFVSSEVAPQDGPYGRFLEMNDAELAGELRGLILETGATPTMDFIELTLAVLRQDVEVNKRYHVGEPFRLPSPVTPIGWTADTGIPPHMMTGWSACGNADFVVLDGHHYSFITAPAALLRVLVDGLLPAGAESC